ncbi:MAG: DUF3276 family protein, partial [Bacteroidota bacterium]
FMPQPEALYTTMVRSGRTTFYVDVKEAKNGSKYLSICESKVNGEQKKERITVRVFADAIEQFKQAVNDAAAAAA